MSQHFSLSDIYDKNLQIVLGAGASAGLFPTLALQVKANDGTRMTIESLATHYTKGREDPSYTALFMHYYKHCIEPVLSADYAKFAEDPLKRNVLENYQKMLETILLLLSRKKAGDHRICNIFTTNYDGCVAHAAEELLASARTRFCLNDGTQGFKRRYLDAKNFTTILTQTGVFMQHRHDLPQINLVQLHGSAYWRKHSQRICVDYSGNNSDRIIKSTGFEKIKPYSAALLEPGAEVGTLPEVDLTAEEIEEFWCSYDKLPIVNPTKWKFHETVFEEHYYQMLRHLSYELERPHTTVIAFGFSFADEHIKNLLRRSLSNPTLQIYICCFDQHGKTSLEKEFSHYRNISLIALASPLDFDAFNEKVFTDRPAIHSVPNPPAVLAPVALEPAA